MRLRTICCLAILVSGCGERASENGTSGAVPSTGANAQSAGGPANGRTAGGEARGTGPVVAPIVPVSLRPGNWQMTVTFNNIEAPGLPEAQAGAMRQQLGRPQSQTQCITPDQAVNPMGNMMGRQRRGCTFANNIFAGGRINVAASCSAPNQGRSEMSMTGNYTPDTINVQIRAEVRPPQGAPAGGPQMVRMSGTMSARRVGSCPGAR